MLIVHRVVIVELTNNIKEMKKYRNSNREMETGDHSKNGASPKSQMSRGNLLVSAKGADVKEKK